LLVGAERAPRDLAAVLTPHTHCESSLSKRREECDTCAMQTNRLGLASCLTLAVAVCLGCAQTQAAQQAHTDAQTKGKYKVRLTTDAESVVGSCKFVAMIEPQQDPLGMVQESQYPDYFRTEAVYKGADTVLVRGNGKIGEAYICGPSPLNPDGTPRNQYDQPPQAPPPQP